MTRTAKIHSKTLQLIVSREDFVLLAKDGRIRIPVQDLAGAQFGIADIAIEPLTRAAMLEHLDLPYPQKWLDRSLAGRNQHHKE